jgi:hypothetical protein
MFAERWNGRKWAIQKIPHPAGAFESGLGGVSCTSARACTAVGYYSPIPETGLTLAERWNGTKWAIGKTPNPAGAIESPLVGVSCTSDDACTAVGDYETRAGEYVPLAERWNGTKWAIQKTPTPARASVSELGGVSCTSASACTAVGGYGNSAGYSVPLVERWNGTKWAIQKTPKPAGATGRTLIGVSCTSARTCTAVGVYGNSARATVTLAERWNGTKWVIRKTPNPARATDSELQGVSCTSDDACTAVGDYYNRAGHQKTLAERHS